LTNSDIYVTITLVIDLLKKKVYVDNKAEKVLLKYSAEVRAEFKALLNKLAKKGYLKMPLAKKIDRDLFEMRVKLRGAWRGFYSYTKKDVVIVLHFFHKKSQKIPRKEINTAKNRLKYYK
jgi:phage-related protein